MCICCLSVFVYSFISPQLPSMAHATLLHIRVIHHSLRFLSMSQSRNPSISYYILHVSGFFILCPVGSPYVSVSVRKSTYQSACLSVCHSIGPHISSSFLIDPMHLRLDSTFSYQKEFDLPSHNMLRFCSYRFIFTYRRYIRAYITSK